MPWQSIIKCQECGEYRVEMRRCEQEDPSTIKVIRFCLCCGLEWWETYIKIGSEFDKKGKYMVRKLIDTILLAEVNGYGYF